MEPWYEVWVWTRDEAIEWRFMSTQGQGLGRKMGGGTVWEGEGPTWTNGVDSWVELAGSLKGAGSRKGGTWPKAPW